MKGRLMAGLLLALVGVSPAAGAQVPHPWDRRLADEIAATVRSYPRFSIFDHVSGQVEEGVVRLTGKVTTEVKKSDIERRIAALDGVRELRSEIAVLPVSRFDDDLRYRISRAIYGDPAFWTYAAMANPPIHIIVENGRVTLVGVVSSNLERMKARSLATGVGELAVENELRVQ